MGLADVNKIDIVMQDKKTGGIVLAIIAFGDWNKDKKMFEQLNTKLSNYVAFIKSPRFSQEFGVTEASIKLMTPQEPTKEIRNFLNEASADTKIPIEVIIQP